ncbi:hypothetical protein N9I59_00160, partial [bacterium]|nr:hypothetical protein [bacterium]
MKFSTTVSSTTCSGTLVEFNIENIPNQISLTEFNFEGEDLPNNWIATEYELGIACTPATGGRADGSSYFWAKSRTGGQRYVVTSPEDVSNGGSVQFYFRYGNDDPEPGCEQPEANGEEVLLFYNTDGTYNFTQVMYDQWIIDTQAYLRPGGGIFPYYKNNNPDWAFFNIEIPDGAKSNQTKFLWFQSSSSGDIYDNWGIDDVVVYANPAATATWTIDFGVGSNDGSPTSPTIVTATSSNLLINKLYPISNISKIYSATVTVVLSDNSAFSITQSVTVDPSDSIPPTVSPPSNIQVDNDPGSCQAVLTLSDTGTPTTLDNCTVVSVENNNPTLTFLNGVNTLTWVVTDNASNTTTVTQTITVNDNENPVLIIPASFVSTTCSVVIDVASASATDNCTTSLTPSYTIESNGGIIGLGSNTIIWRVTDDAGNTVSATQLITVSDTTDPEIIAPSNLDNVKTDDGFCVAKNLDLGTPTTTDDCAVVGFIGTIAGYTGVLSDYEYPIGVTTVTWTVSDTAGNTSSTIQLITVIHDQIPIITVSETTTTVSTCFYILPDPIVTSCTSTTISRTPEGNQFGTGITTITWTVSDTFGNTVTATQFINYVAPIPGITLPANIYVDASFGSCVVLNVDLLGIAIGHVSCGTNSPTNDAPAEFPVGNTLVTWTVTDTQSGITFSKVQSVIVRDVEPPEIILKENISPISINTQGQLNITLDMINEGTIDNCGLKSFVFKSDLPNLILPEKKYFPGYTSTNTSDTSSQTSTGKKNTSGGKSLSFFRGKNLTANCDNLGFKQIEFVAEDIHGNTSSKTITIQIIDGLLICGSPPVPLPISSDSDNDGVINSLDAFPNDPTEWKDSDSDGIGNNLDTDDDDDGFLDTIEIIAGTDPIDVLNFPIDTDADGIIDLIDQDDDNDGFDDLIEKAVGTNSIDVFNFPLDTDSDLVLDFYDTDDDNDGQSDLVEL